MKLLIRERYLSQIRPFYHDGGMIKVLTGIRRSGKSVIMKQICDELISDGVPRERIAYLDLDDRMSRNIKTTAALDTTIGEMLDDKENPRYLFIDEIQNVDGFEEVINGFRNEGVSVFITGSNSYLLSGELSTKLSGRYVEFSILPFSFSEAREYRRLNNIELNGTDELDDYLVFGGFPKRFDYPDESVQEKYIDSVIDETISKDIMNRKRSCNRPLLESMIRFIASVPSAEISSSSIGKALEKEGLRPGTKTLQEYLNLIFSSNVSSKCQRYDVVGKKSLKTLYKSYLADPAIHTFVSGRRNDLDYGMLLENMVYNELISRGYKVMVGKKGPYEIDFVVFRGIHKAYVQTAYSIASADVRLREERPLLAMKDNYPKYIITMDRIALDDKGIKVLRAVDDFLLGNGFEL